MAEIKFESGMSKLYELQTELTRTVENIKILKNQYSVLNEIVENSGKKEDLPEDFVGSLNTYKDNLNNQLAIISNRLGYIKTLIGWYEKQDDYAKTVDNIVTLTLESLGINNSLNSESEQTE